MKSITVIEYCLFVRRRHVGMADDADSKSVGRKPVWVQVPPPAPTLGGKTFVLPPIFIFMNLYTIIYIINFMR